MIISATEHVRTILEGALRVAARQYRDDASDTVIASLKAQFRRQADEAEQLADDIESAELILFKSSVDGFDFLGKGKD